MLKRRGDAGSRGGPSGDLYVDVHIDEHSLFERDDDDLFHEVQIPFALSVLGGTIQVPTLEGKVSLKIPSGTQSNKTFRLKNHGMPNLRYSSRKGDSVCKISIKFQLNYQKEQKEALINFAKSCGEENFRKMRVSLIRQKSFLITIKFQFSTWEKPIHLKMQ